MKTHKLIGQNAIRSGLLGVMLAASGSALAASYNIILKDAGGVIQTCATGGFTFTKTTVGTFPTSGASVALNGTNATPCFGVNQNSTLSSGTLNVTVANVTLNGQDQGPNVTSLSGSLTSAGNGSNSYTIAFAADKSFTVTQNNGQGRQVGSGVYFVYNVNSVPEPETLWLGVAGLGALWLSRRLRRRG